MGQLDRPLAPRQVDQLASTDEGAPEAAAQVDDGTALRRYQLAGPPRREPAHHPGPAGVPSRRVPPRCTPRRTWSVAAPADCSRAFRCRDPGLPARGPAPCSSASLRASDVSGLSCPGQLRGARCRRRRGPSSRFGDGPPGRQKRSKTSSKMPHARYSTFRLVRSPSRTSFRSPMSTWARDVAASISSPRVTETPTLRSSPQKLATWATRSEAGPLQRPGWNFLEPGNAVGMEG